MIKEIKIELEKRNQEVRDKIDREIKQTEYNQFLEKLNIWRIK